MSLNILMDATPILPDLWHFSAPRRTRDDKKFVSPRSRTAHPVKYYWADFGLARRYPPDDPNPLEDPIEGGDKSVPEFQQDPIVPCNPFPTDVYYVGNLIREDFLKVRPFPTETGRHTNWVVVGIQEFNIHGALDSAHGRRRSGQASYNDRSRIRIRQDLIQAV